MDKRLEQFEKMLSDVQRAYDDTAVKMERLRCENKTKTVTYRELMGNRLLYRNMLDTYRRYGLLEE